MRNGILLGVVVALSVALGASLAPATAQSAGSPSCSKYVVSFYNPNDNCKFKGKNPYANREEWCEVPGGGDPMAVFVVQSGMSSVDYIFGVKKCAD